LNGHEKIVPEKVAQLMDLYYSINDLINTLRSLTSLMKFATSLTDRQTGKQADRQTDGISLPDFGTSTTQHGKTQR